MKIPNKFNKLGIQVEADNNVPNLQNGLYLYHPLNQSYSELPTGQTISYSGNAPSLTVINDRAMTYFAGDGHIIVNNTTNKVLAQPFSISWHFYCPNTANYDRGFAGQNSYSNQFRMVLLRSGQVETTLQEINNAEQNGRTLTPESLVDDIVHSIVLNTHDKMSYLYIDGEMVYSTVFSPQSFTVFPNYDFVIGAFRSSSSTRLKGYMSHFRIHERALSDAQIQYHNITKA